MSAAPLDLPGSITAVVLGDGPPLSQVLATTAADRVVVVDRDDRINGRSAAAAWAMLAPPSAADLVVGDEITTAGGRPVRIWTAVPDRFSTISAPVCSGPYILGVAAARRIGWLDDAPPELLWADLIRRVVLGGTVVRSNSILLERPTPRPGLSASLALEWFDHLDLGDITPVVSAERIHLVGAGGSDGSVSAVVPTVGAAGEVDGRRRVFVMELLEHLLDTPPAPLLEVVVVVDHETPGDVREQLDAIRARSLAGSGPEILLIEDPEPDFDFSRKVNLGAARATGGSLLLLNDDTEPLTDRWLDEMCDLERIDGVDVVGATLLYEDDTVQHAGIVAVDGLAGHFGQGRSITSDFAAGRWSTDHSALAVTGAALLTSSTAWERVGGFSRDLPVNYNDLDYCLKVRELGGDVMISAGARLRHFESRSRSAQVDPVEYRALAARWYDRLLDDPYHPGGADVVADQSKEEPVWPSRA